ncbi:MAG: [FeFe] hydrogenase, group A, partial [Chloroflexota bacterium]
AACVLCGQCSLACPTGALHEKSHVEAVWDALSRPDLHVVVQDAPSVRASLGEEFGLPAGTLVTGKMVAALRRMGFAKVFTTNWAADLTIMEEGSELVDRVVHGGALPLITSCSPGWIKYMEHFYPGLIPNASSCKSPQQMFGAVVKSYYARAVGIDPSKMFVVSIMPCTAKKFEAGRPEMQVDGIRDVDAVLTTRELARMIKMANVDFLSLEPEEFDDPLGFSTGAGDIFGVTGGVMEAALRSGYFLITGRELENVDLVAVRGLEGAREATVPIDGLNLKVAVVSGLANASRLLDRIQSGEAEYHFVEVMCCPSGCVSGGGQPRPTDKARIAARARALYELDRGKQKRRSHLNPQITQIYEQFLGQPLGEKSHRLLHTHYTPRVVD